MADQMPESSPSPSSSSSEKPSPSGNWWDSLISSAKNKSAEVYSMVKKDLDEIGCAVKCEANHVLTSTSTVIGKTFKFDEEESPANYMKKSFSSFIGQMSTVLNPEPDDEEDTEVILSSGDTTMLSTYNKELEALQRVDATFIVPANSSEFDAWRRTVESEREGVISAHAAEKRLRGSALLKSQYDRLVPDAVSREDFWERYLFRVALLQDRLAAAARKQPLAAPSTDPVLANLPISTPEPITECPKPVVSASDLKEVESTPTTDKSLAWEAEDFADDVELTEEQQILLLEEYEKEISTKKLSTKQTTTRDIANNNTKDQQTNTVKEKTKQPASKKTQPKDKTNQPRDKLNNKATDKKTPVDKKKNARPAKKAPKSDLCGNNIVEDYFGDKEQKDDSDESWEKEFEIDEVEKA